MVDTGEQFWKEESASVIHTNLHLTEQSFKVIQEIIYLAEIASLEMWRVVQLWVALAVIMIWKFYLQSRSEGMFRNTKSTTEFKYR